jgi:hypothetical protein
MLNFADPEVIKNIMVLSGTISGFVMGLTYIAKTAGLPSNRLPIFALVTGLALSVLAVGYNNIVLAIFVGLQSAFTASGIHSQVSSITKKDEELG